MNDRVKPEMVNKWLDKLEPLIEEIEPKTSQAEELLENMKAYVKDAKHFMNKEEMVLAFEAMIWAWALYEICKNLKIF